LTELEDSLQIETAYLKDSPQFIEELSFDLHNEFGIYHLGGSLEERKSRLVRYMRKKSIPETFIALIDGQLAGTASLIDYDMDIYKNLTPWLASVYTVPKYRRRGVATALVWRILDEARELRIDRLYLFTETLIHFYERFGWKRICETEYKGRSVIVMCNELS
jgi:N-acetylglutamate synthase-like GNAT family acetyltransferase